LAANSATNLATRADILFNLGAIHFMQGYQFLGLFLQGQKPGVPPEGPAAKLRQEALAQFELAAHCFQEALQESPEDVYMLDELARLRFNQAYLLQEPAAWQETIQAYRQLLTSPLKHELGPQPLRESAAFLAHAYTQSQEFDQAELTLGLLSAFHPGFWLVDYLEACLYTQRAKAPPSHVAQNHDLDLALAALERALKSEGAEQARAEALHDPDLALLRQLRKRELMKLLTPTQKENAPA
jgi:hypothetical protein